MRRKAKYTPPKNPAKDKAYDLLAKVEQRKGEIDTNWGKDRFLNLIDPDLKDRLKIMSNKYEISKATTNYMAVINNCEGMLRGLDLCEENAKKRGHKELNGQVWSYYFKRNDTKFLIVKDDHYYPKAVAMSRNEDPQPVVISILELMTLIPQDNWTFVKNIKKEIPGSEVINPTTDEDIDNAPPITSFAP